MRKVRWQVESTRVGKMTNYDRLILEIWTNGVVSPHRALIEVATIMRKHLNPFVQYGEIGEGFADHPVEGAIHKKEVAAASELDAPVAVLDLSVRAGNCMSAAGIRTIGELVTKTESEMLRYPNFGKTTLKEVKSKLEKRNLSFAGK